MRPLVLILAALALAGPAQADGPRRLDDFSEPSLWRAEGSDGVSATARPFEGGLRLDYDFTRGSGYAFIRRALPVDWPEDFDLRFRLRGAGPANALEVKLVDASGENVWWHRRADYVAPGEWQTIRVRRRQVDFAWGPAADRTLRRTAAIEFVVAAGSGGGRGWIAVDDLEIVPRTPAPAVPPPVTARGGGVRPELAVDANRATSWQGSLRDGLVLDLGYVREFGGLVLRWGGQHATAYRVALSNDGRAWREVAAVAGGDGGSDWLRLEESQARYVRIDGFSGASPGVALVEVEVRPLAFGASANAFVAAVAAEAPRGAYPRGFVGEQNYWTLIATPEGGNSGLMDEGGAIEIGRGGFSVEPFVIEDGRLVSWADVEAEHNLLDDQLPIPTVTWRRPGWSLATTAYADMRRDSHVIGRHVLRNDGNVPRALTLVLGIRPFQVNPPQQFLNIAGGVSPIRRIDGDEDVLRINDRLALRMEEGADRVALSAFGGGMQPFELDAGSGRIIDDPTGLASAAYIYELRLAPGESRTVTWEAPLTDLLSRARYRRASIDEVAQEWRAALGDVRISGPRAARPVFDTLRTALAHVLATREGAALRPGSRSYARSWIRDGAMMSTALLRMGVSAPADRYLRWYAPYQYESGKVPCCVDARGADPVPEHDSHGQLIHLAAQLHRYAPDEARLRNIWPRVRAAADHIETLRQSTRVPANRAGGNRPRFGLLPPSISHEGYSARPAYSYWDDFWALTGLKDAAWLAEEAGLAAEGRLLAARAEAFRGDILASIAAARDVHNIAFIPGAADLGDFDATSTTVALAPAGEQHRLPQNMLAATFERYWREASARRDGTQAWDAYTPYEWRNVGALVRLGHRDRAVAMLDFFMRGRRPANWNQWAEVVGRDARQPRFIGDMPHGWVASDFINAVLDMLVYERAADRALVLAGGVPRAWLEEGGLRVERLRTPYGPLSLTLSAANGRTRLTYRLDGSPPPGGLVWASERGDVPLQGARGEISGNLP